MFCCLSCGFVVSRGTLGLLNQTMFTFRFTSEQFIPNLDVLIAVIVDKLPTNSWCTYASSAYNLTVVDMRLNIMLNYQRTMYG